MSVIVLIVEDEPILRFHAADIAIEAGFDVLEAGNAEDAIAILEARADVRIVFTDIQMPGSMDGLKLAHAIRKRLSTSRWRRLIRTPLATPGD